MQCEDKDYVQYRIQFARGAGRNISSRDQGRLECPMMLWLKCSLAPVLHTIPTLPAMTSSNDLRTTMHCGTIDPVSSLSLQSRASSPQSLSQSKLFCYLVQYYMRRLHFLSPHCYARVRHKRGGHARWTMFITLENLGRAPFHFGGTPLS